VGVAEGVAGEHLPEDRSPRTLLSEISSSHRIRLGVGWWRGCASKKVGMKKQKLYPILLVLSSQCVLASGQDLAETPEIVVVASRIEQPREQVGSSVVVLYPDELMERGFIYVSDALREVPSLNLSSYGPRGSQVQVRVRGNEANHVLVLIDGVRVGRADSGEFDFASLGLASLEKIEILLGPQSTLYGNDAAAGVISITTRKGREGVHGQLQGGYGSHTTRTGSLHLRGADQGFHYAVTLEHADGEGISAGEDKNAGNSLEDDGSRAGSLSAKFGYDHQAFQTWIALNRSDSRYDFDDDSYTTGRATDNPYNHQWTDLRSNTWVLALPLLEGRWHNQLQISRVDSDYQTYADDLANAPWVGESKYRADTERKSYEYQGSFELNTNHTLQFGAERIDEELTTTYYSSLYPSSYFDDEVRVKGWYGQWLATFGALDLTLGGRVDDHEAYGNHETYRVTANLRLTDRWRLRGAWGTGFKAPTLLDLYSSLGGNPDLKPEESDSRELGIEYAASGLQAQLTLFDHHTDNLIRWVSNLIPPNFGSLENVDEADSHGIELALQADWDAFELSSSVTWMDASETSGGQTEDRMRVPEWSANLMAGYRFLDGRVWMEALYRGDRRDRNFATSQDVTLDAYWLFNIGVSYEIVRDLMLSARIDNLADKNYEEVFSYGTPGRTGMVSFSWSF
jgi:vitamin B12 transporter